MMRIAVVLAALTLAGCALFGTAEPSDNRADTPEALAAEMGWRIDAFVTDDLGVTAYASRVRNGELQIIGIERRGSEWHATYGGNWEDLGETNTLAMGEGIRGGTVIYGSAESGVARVVTDAPGALGGHVTDGGWVVWSPDDSLREADDTVAWQFIAEDGTILDEGSGWQWPFGSPFDPPPLP